MKQLVKNLNMISYTTKIFLGLFAFMAMAPTLFAELWVAQPIIVHEWGVNTYDWSGKSQKMPEFPAFIYTDVKPGKMTSNTNIVKNLPPDSGIRRKPLLYFYPPTKQPTKVGVEVRFAFGYANAWFPQVDLYRTPELVKGAKPPVEMDLQHRGARILGTPKPVPSDERFELVWNELTLHPDQQTPNGTKIHEVLPDDHWINEARNVDAAVVSNGTGGEAEKFVFYEGINNEGPKICLIAENGGYSLVNTGNHTIYDVTCIYRSGSVRYSKRIDELSPMPQQIPFSGKGSSVVPIMKIPALLQMKVDALSVGDQAKADQEVVQREMLALVQSLTDGDSLVPQRVTMRDPADPQPASTMHTLYQKEAEGLAKIWSRDFFEQEGLTIIYRESPAYLDLAMPLNIYTDMYHFIQLNRCGLVCNSHIPLAKIAEIQSACERLKSSQQPEPKDLQLGREHLLLSKSYFNYFKKQGADAKKIDQLLLEISK